MVVLEAAVSNKTVFLIVGESSSGKDSLVNKLCEECGYKQLISYTTRTIREDDKDDKNKHVFISEDEVKYYVDKMIAYTRIGEFCYFATVDQLYESDIYIIDATGRDYMKFITEYKDVTDIRFVTIYINTPPELRKERALNQRHDNPEVYYQRILDEQGQFADFKACAKFDYAVLNKDFNKAYKILKNIVEEELNESH